MSDLPVPALTDAAAEAACRLLHEALACPGRVLEIDPTRAGRGTAGTALSPAMGAVLRALSERSTPMRLSLATAASADPAIWRQPADAVPAMLVIEVPALHEPTTRPPIRRDDDPDLTPRLCIDGTRQLAVAGIARHFWRLRPDAGVGRTGAGVDLVLCCGYRLAAIGGGTTVRLDD